MIRPGHIYLNFDNAGSCIGPELRYICSGSLAGVSCMRAILLCAVAALALAGCTANDKSIHRNIALPSDKPSAQSVDAKQRFLISVPVTEAAISNSSPVQTVISTSNIGSTSTTSPGTTNIITQTMTNIPAKTERGRIGATSTSGATIQMRFCAEPSPDVFSVYAGALAANLDLKKSATPADLGLGFGLGISTSEQGSTIARTQTINLLKELMYRTCERYASGGIGKLELAVQSVRDQRVIIAALAIEQLTGTVMPKPTIIGAAGTAGTGADAASAVVAIDKRMSAKAAADKALAAAEAKLATANGDTGLCKDKKERADDAKEPTEAEAKACKTAKDEVNQATKDAAQAKVELDTLVKASEVGGPIANVAATLFATEGKGGIDKANPVSIAAVAKAVQEIVQSNYDSSELELLCVKALDPGSGSEPISALVEQCRKYFDSKVKLATARAEKAIAETRNITDEILRKNEAGRCEVFWSKSKDERDKLTIAAKQKYPGSSKSIDQMLNDPDSCESDAKFQQLSDIVQRFLSGEFK